MHANCGEVLLLRLTTGHAALHTRQNAFINVTLCESLSSLSPRAASNQSNITTTWCRLPLPFMRRSCHKSCFGTYRRWRNNFHSMSALQQPTPHTRATQDRRAATAFIAYSHSPHTQSVAFTNPWFHHACPRHGNLSEKLLEQDEIEDRYTPL